MDAKQRLQSARFLLSRSLGVIEFTNEEMANGKSEFMSNLCSEIREFLEPSTPTLYSCGTVEGHGTGAQAQSERPCEDERAWRHVSMARHTLSSQEEISQTSCRCDSGVTRSDGVPAIPVLSGYQVPSAGINSKDGEPWITVKD